MNGIAIEKKECLKNVHMLQVDWAWYFVTAHHQPALSATTPSQNCHRFPTS